MPHPIAQATAPDVRADAAALYLGEVMHARLKRVGHRFNFRSAPMPHWNGVVDCEVLVVEPPKCLAYSWNASGAEAATRIKTVVTWTLTPANGGTHLRMEQSGFRPDQTGSYQGATYGWQKYFSGLERVAAEFA